jgi:hypothetical protein
MKNYCKLLLLLVFTVLSSQLLLAQETEKEATGENKLHHRISLMQAFSHIPSLSEMNGQKHAFIVPTVGLNYELWFNKKWAIGLHNDFIIQSFNIENEDGKPAIKREYPILTTLVGIYKPGKHLSFFAGPGIEFEKTENFNVVKLGIEYGVELSKSYEVGFGFEYDAKINGYSTWLVGIGISKNIFPR